MIFSSDTVKLRRNVLVLSTVALAIGFGFQPKDELVVPGLGVLGIAPVYVFSAIFIASIYEMAQYWLALRLDIEHFRATPLLFDAANTELSMNMVQALRQNSEWYAVQLFRLYRIGVPIFWAMCQLLLLIRILNSIFGV